MITRNTNKLNRLIEKIFKNNVFCIQKCIKKILQNVWLNVCKHLKCFKYILNIVLEIIYVGTEIWILKTTDNS